MQLHDLSFNPICFKVNFYLITNNLQIHSFIRYQHIHKAKVLFGHSSPAQVPWLFFDAWLTLPLQQTAGP